MKRVQDVGEKVSRDCDLRQLESDIAAAADDLRADLDRLFLQARQRPVPDRFGRRQRAQEIAEIVGQRMKLKADGVRGERATGKPGPADRALALLSPLFARAAPIAEADDILNRPRRSPRARG